MYDIPAMIKYVQKITGRDKIVHMGHSMGTTSFYAMLSKKPEMNDKILAHISLAPVAYMDRMRSLEVLRPITLIIKQLIVSNQKNLIFKNFLIYTQIDIIVREENIILRKDSFRRKKKFARILLQNHLRIIIFFFCFFFVSVAISREFKIV